MELILEQITKTYGKKAAVNNMSLKLTKGVYGLLGANGAGKSTLMRIMCGILKADIGTVHLDGMSVSTEGYREALGYLPQHFGYYPDFTTNEFMCYMGTLKGMPKKKAKAEAEKLLDLLGMSESGKKKIKTLSGGMKQRIGIAQALLNNPKLLILDEPTAGLDPKERVRLRNMISQLGNHKIVLLSTHIVSDIDNIAKQILLMKEGAIVHQGTGEEVLATIEGKIWECIAFGEEVQRLMKTHPVINIRQEQKGTFLRLVADHQPTMEARSCPANLEDLYLYYFNEGEENQNEIIF